VNPAAPARREVIRPAAAGAASRPAVCFACRRALPPPDAGGLAARILAALAEGPLPVEALARRVGRRVASVRAELAALQTRGLVERVAEKQGRAWNRRPWRLAEAPGRTWDGRQDAAEAWAGLPTILATLAAQKGLPGALALAGLVLLAASFLFAVRAEEGRP
jgi:DNA-binding transcriptional ArsR family regulator